MENQRFPTLLWKTLRVFNIPTKIITITKKNVSTFNQDLTKTHKDLDVWKYSIDLVVEVYQLLKKFPDDEKFGIISQMKRCAVSIASNIAEGAARSSVKEFSHFLTISLGSVAELETQIIISKRLDFISDDNSKILLKNLTTIRKMLLGLKKSLKDN